VVGPLLAGVLIASIGAPNVLVLDALSYVAFALALAGIKRVPVARDDEGKHEPGARRTLLDVVRFLAGNRVVLSTTVMFAFANLGLGLLNVWLPILSDQLPGGGPELYGLLLGALALGEVVGSVLAGSAQLSLPLGSRICVAQVLAGASFGLLFLGASTWMVAIALGLFGFFSAPLTIWAQTLRMEIIPPLYRGRAFALLRTMMQSTPPIGAAIAGPLLVVFGLPPAIAATALLVGVPGAFGYALPDLRKAHPHALPDAPEPVALANDSPAA
jgi:MFS family permease